MFFNKNNTISVPKNLSHLTTIPPKAETSPYDVEMTRDGVEAIWSSVESFYRTGLQPGISLVMRRQGQVVINRSLGHARGNEPKSYEGPAAEKSLLLPETPICFFSASKAITAMLAHKLKELGLVKLTDKVGEHIPEFACNGKENITIAQVLSHRAGVPTIQIKNPHPSLLFRWESVVDLINSAYAADKVEFSQAYHAITGGYIIGELVNRVTGKPVNEFLKKYIADPLGATHLTFGLPEDHHDDAAFNYSTGMKPVFPVNVLAKRALGTDFEKIANISNTPEFMNSTIPAGNIYGTAEELCRFYQMMLDGGVWEGKRVFEEETIREAVAPTGPITFDSTLMIPIRYSNGFMLGESLFSLFGVKAKAAYGHLGLMNIVGWADPTREISVALLNTGKTLDPMSFPALAKILISVTRNASVTNPR